MLLFVGNENLKKTGGKTMKRLGVLVFMFSLLFLSACFHSNKESKKEEVSKLDRVIAEIMEYKKESSAVKRVVENSVGDGIYIDKVETIDYYSLNYLASISFEEKVELLTEMETHIQTTYVVVDSVAKLFKDYVSLSDLLIKRRGFFRTGQRV